MIDFDVYCQLRGIFVYFCSKTPIYKVLVGTNNPLQLYLQKKNKIFDLEMYLTFRDLTIQDRHFLVCCFGFWRFKIGTSWFDEIGFNTSRSALLDSLFRDLTFQDWNFLIRSFEIWRFKIGTSWFDFFWVWRFKISNSLFDVSGFDVPVTRLPQWMPLTL